jgi:hypothetical protein
MRVLTPSMVLLNDEFTAKWAIRDWGGNAPMGYFRILSPSFHFLFVSWLSLPHVPVATIFCLTSGPKQ